MSFKRRVLSALGKDLLLEIGRGLELDVTTRMGVAELRDALARSKRAKLDAIVTRAPTCLSACPRPRATPPGRAR